MTGPARATSAIMVLYLILIFGLHGQINRLNVKIARLEREIVVDHALIRERMAVQRQRVVNLENAQARQNENALNLLGWTRGDPEDAALHTEVDRPGTDTQPKP